MTTSGALWCWGENATGQLGDGSFIASPLPVRVAGLSGVVDFELWGFAFRTPDGVTCAIDDSDALWCWGESMGTGRPERISLPAGVVDVALTAGHVCAVTTDEELYCWGSNDHGQLGRGAVGPFDETPERVSGLGPVTSVTVGIAHTCALLTTGRVRCFGDNAQGQVGTALPLDQLTPVELLALASVVQLDAGGGVHTCARQALGDVRCWGSDLMGQQANGPGEMNEFQHHRIDVPSATWLGGGALDSCVAAADGSVTCWGARYDEAMDDLVATDEPWSWPGFSDVVRVDASGGLACAVDSTGRLACAGRGIHGRLGDGTTSGYRAGPGIVQIPPAG